MMIISGSHARAKSLLRCLAAHCQTTSGRFAASPMTSASFAVTSVRFGYTSLFQSAKQRSRCQINLPCHNGFGSPIRLLPRDRLAGSDHLLPKHRPFKFSAHKPQHSFIKSVNRGDFSIKYLRPITEFCATDCSVRVKRAHFRPVSSAGAGQACGLASAIPKKRGVGAFPSRWVLPLGLKTLQPAPPCFSPPSPQACRNSHP